MENKEKHTCCSIPGCTSSGVFRKGVEYFPKGYCKKHYQRFKAHGDPQTVLFVQNTGNPKHPLYKTWDTMKQRTSNPNDKDYPDYGGRGIRVCDRWLGPYGFRNFLEDMGEKPENHSLDRIDNNGNYSKENCRWATIYEQHANKRNNNETVGVGWLKQRSKWQAYIRVEGKLKNLGSFINYADAVAARRAAEVLHKIKLPIT